MQMSDILDTYNISYQTEGRYCRDGWLQLDCPFCDGSDPNKPYLGYNIDKRYFNCWSCGYKKAIEILMELIHESYGKCASLFYNLSSAQLDGTKTVRPHGTLVLPSFRGSLLHAHSEYLIRRLYTPNILATLWGLEGIGVANRLQWRLFIPIHYNGRVVSWTTRSLVDDTPMRYISAGLDEELIPHRDLLYGEDFVRHGIIVHEGPADVWRTGPGSVATFGTGFTPAQVLKISKYPLRVICYDSQPAAQQQAKKLCEALMVFPGRTVNVTLIAKDAGEANETEIQQLRALIT